MLDALSVMNIYQNDHMMIFGIYLSTLEELRVSFVCRGDKRFIVNCYIDTSFVTYTNKFYLN